MEGEAVVPRPQWHVQEQRRGCVPTSQWHASLLALPPLIDTLQQGAICAAAHRSNRQPLSFLQGRHSANPGLTSFCCTYCFPGLGSLTRSGFGDLGSAEARGPGSLTKIMVHCQPGHGRLFRGHQLYLQARPDPPTPRCGTGVGWVGWLKLHVVIIAECCRLACLSYVWLYAACMPVVHM